MKKRVPVGLTPRSLREIDDRNQRKVQVALSTSENNLECRVALGRAPKGRKLIAPCGCTGSQQWVQFAELNRLRRREPSQWITCQTCQQKYDYSLIKEYGGVWGNLLSICLDNKQVLRAIVGTFIVLISMTFPIASWMLRCLTSRALWQLVSRISTNLFIYLTITIIIILVTINLYILQVPKMVKNSAFTSRSKVLDGESVVIVCDDILHHWREEYS